MTHSKKRKVERRNVEKFGLAELYRRVCYTSRWPLPSEVILLSAEVYEIVSSNCTSFWNPKRNRPKKGEAKSAQQEFVLGNKFALLQRHIV